MEEGADEANLQGLKFGDPCCQSHDLEAEGCDTVITPVVNFLPAMAWEVSDVQRWTYILKLWKRFILASLGPGPIGILPQILVDMQTNWGVDLTMVAMLERIIAADKQDYTARRKLKLLRSCQHLHI